MWWGKPTTPFNLLADVRKYLQSVLQKLCSSSQSVSLHRGFFLSSDVQVIRIKASLYENHHFPGTKGFYCRYTHWESTTLFLAVLQEAHRWRELDLMRSVKPIKGPFIPAEPRVAHAFPANNRECVVVF